MSDEMMSAEERNKVKIIEEVTCQLSGTVGNALGRANTINGFFFGDAVDKTTSDSKKPESTAWFEMHTRVLRRINDRVQDIYDALGNIHEVVDRK